MTQVLSPAAASPDVDVERSQARLDYAQAAFDAEHERFDRCEEKVMRYLNVLGLIFGAIAFSIAEVRTLWVQGTVSVYIFLLAYAGAFAAALGALMASLATLRVEGLPMRDVQAATFGTFSDSRYTLGASLYALSTRCEEATRKARTINDRRYRSAHRAFLALCLALVCVVLSLGVYLTIPEPTDDEPYSVDIRIR